MRVGIQAAICLSFLLAGCGKVKTPTEPPPAEPGGEAFAFSRIQTEIFSPVCAQAGCHDAGVASGEMVLEAGRSYGEIVDRPSAGRPGLDRVEPGDPERSYLLKKLRGDPDIVGDRMPLTGGPLRQDQIDGIAAWIRAGAPND
jgi:hypothetical protein